MEENIVSKDFETSMLIIEDLLRDYELAVKEAELWWIEYKARENKRGDDDKLT